MLIVSRREPTEEELIEHLSEEMNFLLDLTSFEGHEDGEPTEPYDYQVEFIRGREMFRADIKSRQVGYSAQVSMRAFLRSELYAPGSGGQPPTSIFVSMSLDDAKEKMRYLRLLHDSLPAAFKRPFRTSNVFEIEWDNGARVVCMHLPRGKGPADVYIDEEAYIKDTGEIKRGALGILSRGGSLRVGGTPAGMRGWLYDLFEPQSGVQDRDWRLVKTEWWHCPALCTNVRTGRKFAPSMHTDDRIEQFGTPILRAIRNALTLEDFQQEYECRFVDDALSYFPWELLLAAVDNELDTYDTFPALAQAKTGDLFAGLDLGRRRHSSELLAFEHLGSRLYHRLMRSYSKTPFGEQEADLRQFLATCEVSRLRADETGLGMQLVESLAQAFPCVEGVTFTPAEKARMANIVRMALEKRDLVLPGDRDYLGQWHSIRKSVLPSGTLRFDVEDVRDHHADKFWGAALAISGALSYESPLAVGSSVTLR